MNKKEDFTYSPSEKVVSDIIKFYKTFESISINQYPEWENINNPDKKVCYYTCYDNDILSSCAIILESHSIAYLNYGPLGKTNAIISKAIESILNYHKSIGILKVVIKLGLSTNNHEEIFKTFDNRFVFDSIPYNWSTLIINLDKGIDDILKGFSSNHKRSIKKAVKNNISVRQIEEQEIPQIAQVYDQMYEARKLIKSFDDTQKVFTSIYHFFKTHNNGIVLGVFKENTLIGGLILPIQGNTIYYQYGMTHPDHRKLPILHIGFFEAIKHGIDIGLSHFDFGGYIPNVSEKDQVYSINKFKKQFGGELLVYPKNMHFILSPFKYRAYKIMKKVYTTIRK